MKGILLNTLLFIVLSAGLPPEDNWPQFRGIESNQLVGVGNTPSIWSEDQHVAWKFRTEGRGWSSPIIWEGKVFFTSATLDLSKQATDSSGVALNPENNPEQGVYRMEVYCVDLYTGKELWKRVAYEGKPRIPTHRDNTYASETPVTDGERIYAYFGMTGLYCYNFEGKLLWEKDMGAYITQKNWGTSTSPLIYNDLLLMQIDSEETSYIMAINSRSGEPVWRQERDEQTNWSTPIIWKNRLRTELVSSGQRARSFDPETGKLIWELDLGGGRNISSPVADKEMLYLGNEEREGSGGTLFAVRAGSAGDITPSEGDSTSTGVVWLQKKSGLAMSSPLLYNGYVYIVERRRGAISCFDASSGKPAYQGVRIPDAGPFWASPWAFGGKIFCLDEKGTTHVLEAGPVFNVLYQNKINDKFWASPAMVNGTLVLRGVNKIYCIR